MCTVHTPLRPSGITIQESVSIQQGFVSYLLLNLVDDLVNVIRGVTGFHIEIVLHGLAGLSLLQPRAFDNIFKVNLPAGAGFYQRFPQSPKATVCRRNTISSRLINFNNRT